MDGNFVSKSQIPSVSPQESFSCSLGVDPSIRVTVHPQKKVVRTTGGGLMNMSSKSDVTSFTQRISIKNTRPTTVNRLIVKDQVPLSEDSRIVVTVTKPSDKIIGPPDASNSMVGTISKASSSGSGETSTLVQEIQRGVIARWAQKNEDAGGTGGSKGDGVVEWICSDVGKALDLDLEYEVSAPHDVRWVST